MRSSKLKIRKTKRTKKRTKTKTKQNAGAITRKYKEISDENISDEDILLQIGFDVINYS
tara:strand:+ start:15388 stop:15564 length:177 start_codon:yes stop_codon:yes gene_type:complete